MGGHRRGSTWWQRIFCSDTAYAADHRPTTGDTEWNYLWLLPGDAALAAPGPGSPGIIAPPGTAP